MIVVPTPLISKIPLIVTATEVLLLVKVISSPELAVAPAEKGSSPYETSGNGVKVIVWSAFITMSVC